MSTPVEHPVQDHLDIESPTTTVFDFDYTRRARAAAAPLRQGHAPPVDRQRPPRLVARDRPRQPGRDARRDQPAVRLAVVGQDERRASTARCAGTSRRGASASSCTASRARSICTAKIVQTVPDIDSKFYAATQVIDEARHVEVYSRYLHEKVAARLPAEPAPREPAAGRHRRPPLGHDVPRHAGASSRVSRSPRSVSSATWRPSRSARRSTPT